MARHQVLQHRLVSCTSAIPHPFCQRHPKIQFRACVTSRAGSALPQSRACHAALARHFLACRCRVPRPPIFGLTHDSTSISTTQPHTETSISIDKFFDMVSFHRNHSATNGTTPTPTPAWTKPSRSTPTLQVNYTHRYALVTLHRHDAFLS